MQHELPQEPVTIRLIDTDFLTLELGADHCHVEVKWVRQVSGEEYRRGLELVVSVALKLKAELKQTRALLQA